MTNGEDRVAVVLSSLHSDAANSVIQLLSTERRGRIRGLMQQQSPGTPPAELLERLIRDLANTMAQPPALKIAHTPANDPVGKDSGTEEPDPNDPVALLRALDHERLIQGLEGEHPQTVATVIGCLVPESAGDLLKRLPAETRRAVFLRLGQHSSGPADLTPRIVRAIVEKCQKLAQSPLAEKSDAKYQRMADVLKRLERTDRMELLAALNDQDSTTAAMVKDRLYLFEDLRQIEDRSVQKLLAEIDSKTLATALSGADEEISEKVLNNLSKRGREMVTEEMSFLGHVPPAQVQQAQKSVVDVIQRLDQAGELVMVQEG